MSQKEVLEFSGCQTEDDVYDVLNGKICDQCGGPLGYNDSCLTEHHPEFFEALQHVQNIEALKDPELQEVLKLGDIPKENQIEFIDASRKMHFDIHISYWCLQPENKNLDFRAFNAAHKLCYTFLKFVSKYTNYRKLTVDNIQDLYLEIQEIDKMYPNVGVSDSAVRERMFDLLSNHYPCPYVHIWELWLAYCPK